MKKDELPLYEVVIDILNFHVDEYSAGTHPDYWEAQILAVHYERKKVKK